MPDIVENAVLPKVTPSENLPPNQQDMDNAILEDPYANRLLPSQAAGNDGYHSNYHSNHVSNHYSQEFNTTYGDGLNLKMVNDILKKTSQTVQDLDKYLAVNGELKPSKN